MNNKVHGNRYKNIIFAAWMLLAGVSSLSANPIMYPTDWVTLEAEDMELVNFVIDSTIPDSHCITLDPALPLYATGYATAVFTGDYGTYYLAINIRPPTIVYSQIQLYIVRQTGIWELVSLEMQTNPETGDEEYMIDGIDISYGDVLVIQDRLVYPRFSSRIDNLKIGSYYGCLNPYIWNIPDQVVKVDSFFQYAVHTTTDTVTYQIVSSRFDVSIDLYTGIISWYPDSSCSGKQDTITIIAQGPTGCINEASFKLYVLDSLQGWEQDYAAIRTILDTNHIVTKSVWNVIGGFRDSRVDMVDLSYLGLTIIPSTPEILALIPSKLDLSYNRLCSLESDVIQWLDLHYPDWSNTQLCSNPLELDIKAVEKVLSVNQVTQKNAMDVITVTGGRVSRLNLYRLGITVIPPDIGQLDHLTYLNLDWNRLEALPEEIGCLDSLDTLILKRNSLKSLPVSIGALKNLQYLTLYDNLLYHLPSEISDLSALEVLDIEDNNLYDLPQSLEGLQSLREFNAGINDIRIIPPSLYSLNSLVSLYLNHNDIDSLSSEIGQLINLVRLNISYNNIAILPVQIGNLAKLEILEMSYNQISVIPSSIGNLSQLLILYMDGNLITELPGTIGNLGRLREWEADHNSLASLPTEIVSLVKLRKLLLHNNILTGLPVGIQAMDSLEYLSANDNQLQEFPNQVCACSLLKSLDLRNNRIGFVPPEIGSLKKLCWLNLAGNSIPQVPSEINQIYSGCAIYFDQNLIGSLPEEITYFVPSYFGISYNNLCSVSQTVANWLDYVSYYNWAGLQYCGTGWQSDSIIIQCILDTNNITDKTVDKVVSIDFKRVVELRLGHTGISLIVPEISQLTALKSCDFYMNNLKNLPDEIMGLQLRTLNINYNKLCAVNDSLGNWLDGFYKGWRTTQTCDSTGRTERRLEFINGKGPVRVEAIIGNMMRIVLPSSPGERCWIEVASPDGRIVWRKMVLVPVHDESGIVVGSLVTGIYFVKVAWNGHSEIIKTLVLPW